MGSKKDDKELTAIDKILDAFKGIADDRKYHVLEYVRGRLDVTGQHIPKVLTVQQQTQSISPSIDTFVRDKKPITDYQRIAALGYYMQINEQKEEFNRKDLVDANTRARQPRFTNIGQAVLDAKHKYGYISDGRSKGMLQLTTMGEDVINALPDQTAARSIKKLKKSKRRNSKKLIKVSKSQIQ